MRVLLINPALQAFETNKEFTPPLSLLYLSGALLDKDIEVNILDLNIYKPWENPEGYGKYTEDIIVRLVEEFKPSLIGFTCMFSGQFPGILKYSERIKDLYSEIPIVIGGTHPTLFVNDIMLNCPSIDYVILGEGEEQIVALSLALQRKDKTALSDIEGISYRHGNIVLQPKKKYLIDLDSQPAPGYSLINIKDYYHSTSHWHNPKGLRFHMTFPVLSSRSCPNKCNFCSNYLVMGSKLRRRSPDNVLDEIQFLYEHYGQNHFSFMDDNITLNKKHILSLCIGILERKLKIQFETPNGVYLPSLDREVMDAMVQAGWVRGALAIESGSDFIRNSVMGKRLTREKIDEVVSLSKTYDSLYLKGAFIMGFPEDTPETLMDSYELIREMKLDEVFVTNLMPYPGTDVFNQAMRDSLFVEQIDTKTLWKATGFHYHTNKQFYIKPYRMTIEELQGWRRKFDDLIDDKCH